MITNTPPEDVMQGILLVAALAVLTTCAKNPKDNTVFLANEEACLSDSIQAEAARYHAALLASDTPRVVRLPLDRRPSPVERAVHDSTRIAYENHMRRINEAEAFASYAISRKHAYGATYTADSLRMGLRKKDPPTPDILRFEHRARLHTAAAGALDRTIRSDLASLYARRLAEAAIKHGAACHVS